MISRWILQILDSKILICRWILRILDLKIMIYRGILWILDPDFLPRHMSANNEGLLTNVCLGIDDLVLNGHTIAF